MIATLLIFIAILFSGNLFILVTEELEYQFAGYNSPKIWQSIISCVAGLVSAFLLMVVVIATLVGLEKMSDPEVAFEPNDGDKIVQSILGQDEEGEYVILDLEDRGPMKLRPSEIGERFDWEYVKCIEAGDTLVTYDAFYDNWLARHSFFGNVALDNEYLIKQ